MKNKERADQNSVIGIYGQLPGTNEIRGYVVNTVRSVLWVFLICSVPLSSVAVVDEPGGGAYHFVKSYRISIDASAEMIWPHVVALEEWMFDFEMAPVDGTPGRVGHVVRLYEGQDFQIMLTAVEPGRLLAMANLPMLDRGETGTGTGVVQLTPVASGTEVSLIMSRRYEWSGGGENPLKQTRQSPEFNARTDAMWQRFLERLKAVAEGTSG